MSEYLALLDRLLVDGRVKYWGRIVAVLVLGFALYGKDWSEALAWVLVIVLSWRLVRS